MKPQNSRELSLISLFREKLSQSPKRVLSHDELLPMIVQLRVEHGFPRSLSERNFLRRLIEDGVIKEVSLSATYSFDAKRYYWGPFSDYELALSLKQGAYISHGTAALIHNLLGHEPSTVYINKEQSPKNSRGTLTQAGIDRAFSNSQRQSSYIVKHEKTQIVLLSGKHSNRLGVISVNGPQGEPLEVTDIERTLIDMAVRPSYAGGAKSVAKAYRNAFSRTSVSRITKMLGELAYIYPYHQTLGFYLQDAGHSSEALKPLRDLGLKFNFYLEHGMKQPRLDPSWRIYYPRDFDAHV